MMRALVAVLALASAAPTLAQELKSPVSPAPTPAGYGKTEGVFGGVLIGPKLNLINLPTPSFGLEAKIFNTFGLSFDYGGIPTVGTADVEVGFTNWSLGAKYYPWKKSFFVGAMFGQRSFTASASDSDPFAGTLKAEIDVSSTYVAPEIGWRWVWNSGFFMGMELGWQFVVSNSTDLTVSGSAATPALQAQLADLRADVNDAGDTIGKAGLPVIGFLQLGYFF